jgi:hypothetical protein
MLLLALLCVGCTAPTFRPPAAPVAPGEPPPAPRVPQARRVVAEEAVAARTEAVVAADLRTARRDILAVGPMTAGTANLAPELLRRLLRAARVRVLDLSEAHRLAARLQGPENNESLSLEGPLLAGVWGLHLGGATHLLVAEPIAVGQVTRHLPAVQRYDLSEIEAYGPARESAIAACKQLQSAVWQTLGRYRSAFEDADAEYERDRPWWADLVGAGDGEREEARRVFESNDSTMGGALAACSRMQSLPTADALRAAEGAALAPAETRRVRAAGVFRVLEVPGARVVWAAVLEREADDRQAALEAILDALVEALPFGEPPRAARADREPSTRRSGGPTR